MTDIFIKEDLCQLLKNKHVVFIGDSNVRALYKDMLCLFNGSFLIPDSTLMKRMPNSVYGDKMLKHGEKNNGRDYREERAFSLKGTKINFFFVTRVFSDYVKDIIQSMTHEKGKPDIIVINSCVWDISRWGPNGVEEYRKNFVLLMKYFQRVLHENCLVIWLTTLPVAQELKGGFLVKQLEFLQYSMRFHIMEANNYARKVVVAHGYDVLDVHYHLRMQIHRRCPDGIHWWTEAIRYVTNLLLTHISLAWDVPLPHRYEAAIIHQPLEVETDDETLPIEDLFIKREKRSRRRRRVSRREQQSSRHRVIKFSSPQNRTKVENTTHRETGDRSEESRMLPETSSKRRHVVYSSPIRSSRRDKLTFKFSKSPISEIKIVRDRLREKSVDLQETVKFCSPIRRVTKSKLTFQITRHRADETRKKISLWRRVM